MITIDFTPATASDLDIFAAMIRVARVQEAAPSIERLAQARQDMGTLSWHAAKRGIPAAVTLTAIEEGKRQAREA